MKNKLVPFLLGLAALLSIAAVSVNKTEQLVRIQAELPSGAVTAFFEESVSVDGVVYRQPWESVSWAASEKTVTVGGESKTYSQVMAFVVAIAAQERAEAVAAKANPPSN
jgi:hypothetical protein